MPGVNGHGPRLPGRGLPDVPIIGEQPAPQPMALPPMLELQHCQLDVMHGEMVIGPEGETRKFITIQLRNPIAVAKINVWVPEGRDELIKLLMADAAAPDGPTIEVVKGL